MPTETKEAAPVIGEAKSETKKVENKPESKERKRRGRFNKKLLILIIASAALIIGGIVTLILIIANSGPKEVNVFETDAFFLPDNDKTNVKYALFKNNGERLTGFDFSEVGEFINGYAIVRNGDHKYGIIEHTGRMAVDFDSYEDIMPHTGFYEVKKSADEKSIILGDGREVSSSYDEAIYDSGAPFSIIKSGNSYALYNVLGERLSEFESDEKPVLDSYSSESFSYVSYGNHFILLNDKSLKNVAEKDLGKKYEIDSASKDLSIAVLVERSESKDKAYAIYYNNELKEFGDTCKDIDLYEESRSGRRYLSCKKSDGKTFLIRSGEISDIELGAVKNVYRIFDENHYVNYNSEQKTATIYADGAEVITLNADYPPYVSLKGYYLRNYKDKNISLYGLDGSKIYTLDGSSYSDLTGLDQNDNITVRDSGQQADERYYLVNKSGDVISGKYSSLYQNGEFYSALKSTDKRGDLLGKDGEVIVSGNYSSFEFYKNQSIILGRISSTEFDLIDVKDKKVKQKLSGATSYYRAGYIKVTSDKKITYYTVDGEKIHEFDRK